MYNLNAFFCTERGCSDDSVLDVVFVIDRSASIGPSHFQLIREFIANISSEVLGNSPNSAVGVISFGATPRIVFNLQTYTSLSSLLSAINQIRYHASSRTNTNYALSLLLRTAQSGALGLRNDSSKVAILITDGYSRYPLLTSSAAAELHASNIFDIYAVGVDRAYLTGLQGIASSPEFVFFTSSFNSTGLQLLQEKILSQLCQCKYKISIRHAYVYVCMNTLIFCIIIYYWETFFNLHSFFSFLHITLQLFQSFGKEKFGKK